MAQDLLYLRWKNHYTSLCSSFLQLFSSHDSKLNYDDATIACDGKLYPVHRLVLSVCSDYFADMFAATSAVGRHPIIVLKDIPSDIFEVLLKFIYIGEVNVERSKFSALVNVARCLKVSGLASYEGGGILEDASDVKPDKKRKAAATESSTEAVDVQAVGKIRRTNNDTRQKTEGPMPDQPPSLNKEEQTSTGQVVLKDTTQPSQSSSVSASNILAEEDGLPPMDSPDVNLPLAYESVSDDSRDSLQVDSSETGHSLKMCSVRLSPVGSDVSKDGYVAGEDRKSKDSKDKSNEPKISCPLCTFHCHDSKDLDSHMSSHTPVQEEVKFSSLAATETPIVKTSVPSAVLPSPAKDPLQCILCSTHCNSESELSLHYHTHKRDDGFYCCCYCNFATRDRSNLVIHHRIHTGEKPFQCFFCTYTSRSPYGLRSHYEKESHPLQTLANCPKCPYASKESSELEEHMMYSHPEGNIPYKCPKCSFLASDRSQYIGHMRSHPPQTKSWFCVRCYYCTYDLKAFNFHVKTRHKKKNISVGQKFAWKEIEGQNTPPGEVDLGKIGEFSAAPEMPDNSTNDDSCVDPSELCGVVIKQEVLSDDDSSTFDVPATETRDVCESVVPQAENVDEPDATVNSIFEVAESHPFSNVQVKVIKPSLMDMVDVIDDPTFVMKTSLMTYLSVDNPANPLINKTDNNEYRCNDCFFLTPDPEIMTKHVKEYIKTKQYACDRCNFRSKYSKSIEKHKMKGKSNKLYKCPTCKLRTCCPLPTHWYPCYQAWEQSKTDEVLPYRKGRRPLEPSIFDSCYASSASEGYSMKDDVSDAASQSNGEYSLNNEVVESDDNLKVENESNSGKISDAKYKLNVIDRKAGTEEKPNDLLNNDDCASYLNALDASEKSVSSGNPEKDKHPTNLDKNFDIGANKRLESCIETSDVMALETGNIFTDHSSGFDVNSADDEENFIQCDPISVDPMDHVAEFDEDQNNEENGELETLVPLTEVSGLNQIDGMNAEPSGKKAETSKEEVSNFASMKSPLAFSFASSDVDDSLDLNSVS
ncbi:hypothetical protein HAZT_HAZT004267 [Hyalella azteca]|uniref:BTB domain-containing protein n=1 Tax=Hyalella azteca TaxID=294128 RepID=A0A6A0GSM1_HYAAZ|nr:hypothetical protein HAZT_HAZT004267 [Hyalella azteca]